MTPLGYSNGLCQILLEVDLGFTLWLIGQVSDQLPCMAKGKSVTLVLDASVHLHGGTGALNQSPPPLVVSQQ